MHAVEIFSLFINGTSTNVYGMSEIWSRSRLKKSAPDISTLNFLYLVPTCTY